MKIVNIKDTIEVELVLKKSDLLGDSKWQFVYNKTIEAKIEDEDFLAKVRNEQIKNLYAGVIMPCKLQFEYDVDQNYEIIAKSEKYTILKVTGDIVEPQEAMQKSLFGKRGEI